MGLCWGTQLLFQESTPPQIPSSCPALVAAGLGWDTLAPWWDTQG